MLKTSQRGIDLLHHFESCKLKAYPDPGTGGAPWTIGWGHTGAEVVSGLTWTQEKADSVFRFDLQRFEAGVGRLASVPLAQHQFDALVAFSFNVGLGNLEKSTLLRNVNAGDFEGAAAEFGRWNKAAGKVMAGLTRRRAAEADLFRGL